MSRERARAVENALTLYTKNRVSHLRNNAPEPNFNPFKSAVNAYIKELLNSNRRPGFFSRNRWSRWRPPRSSANMNMNNRRNNREKIPSPPPLPPKPKPNQPPPKPNMNMNNRRNNREKIPGVSPPPLPPKPKPNQPPPKPNMNNNRKKRVRNRWQSMVEKVKIPGALPKPNNVQRKNRNAFKNFINARGRNLKMVSNITGQKTRETGNWFKARGQNIGRGAQGAWKSTGNWFSKAGTDIKGAWGELSRGYKKRNRSPPVKKVKPSGMPSILGRHGAVVSRKEYKNAVNRGIQPPYKK